MEVTTQENMEAVARRMQGTTAQENGAAFTSQQGAIEADATRMKGIMTQENVAAVASQQGTIEEKKECVSMWHDSISKAITLHSNEFGFTHQETRPYAATIDSFISEFSEISNKQEELDIKWKMIRRMHETVEEIPGITELLQEINSRIKIKDPQAKFGYANVDILCVPGNAGKHHKGNLFFMKIAKVLFEEHYEKIEIPKQKSLFLQELNQVLWISGHRFVKQDKKTKEWYCL